MIRQRRIKDSKTFKMKLPVISVNSLQPLTNVTKNHTKGPTSASVRNDKRDTPNVGRTDQIKRKLDDHTML